MNLSFSVKQFDHFGRVDFKDLYLENLTFGLAKPCVMDIKIGKITYGPDATEAKIAKESKRYSSQSI